jgi:hypothetical protein
MSQYSFELDESTATLTCSCCSAGLTSVCGFIKKDDRPYCMYYALIHNNPNDVLLRLSVSIGEWWRHDTYENRHALCIDITPHGENCRMSVQDAAQSPQHNFAQFGKWLDRADARDSHLLQDFIDVATLITRHDPAVRSYLAGQELDYSNRNRKASAGDPNLSAN